MINTCVRAALAVALVAAAGVVPSLHASGHDDGSVTTNDATGDAAIDATTDATGASVELGAEPVAELDEVRTNLEAQLPGMTATSIDATPVPGLYEAVVDGRIYYVDASGEYLVDGSLVHLPTRENLTEARLGTLHMATLAEIPAAEMLTYTPDEPTGRSITVFTDISCGYCRKLHADLDVLLDAGVAVNYLMFPRAGLGTEGESALESVWCSDDPQTAMTVAKSGGQVPTATCDTPIEKHVAIAERVGLRGTPLIYTDAGERIPGYREPAELVRMVEASEAWVSP